MKLYPNLCRAVVDSLTLIFEHNKYADKVIEKTLKQNPKWGARDRRFIAETTYDIVRWYRLFQNASKAKERDYWGLIATWCIARDVQIPNWKEFKGINPGEAKKRLEDPSLPRAIRESIPDWLDKLCGQALGDRWDKELRALNTEAEVVLRTNTLKTTTRELQAKLYEEGTSTSTIESVADALVLERRQNIFQSPLFKGGLFEVQDAGSQLIAPFLKVEPGHRVIDACAGAGGKSLHLASLMKNSGRIIAMDTEQWKLDELKKRARRADATNIETRLIDSSKVIKRLAGTADRLLLDVPCSGLGVLRRNPDAKWKLSSEFIEKLKALQQQILSDYSRMVKPGGMMVYSTCSILPDENERQVAHFLSVHPEFRIVDEQHVWPSEGFDGFYMARLIKK